MTIDLVHRAVKLKIDKSDSLNYTSYLPEEIDFWLNQALTEWVKTRMTGNNAKRESLEQTQKRIDDLRTLLKESSILTTSGSNKPNSFIATLPSDYLYAIGEEVNIDYLKTGYSVIRMPGNTSLTSGKTYLVGSSSVIVNNPAADALPSGSIFIATNGYLSGGNVTLLYTTRTGITETTSDRYSSDIDNPFANHVLQYGKAKPLRLFFGSTVELISDGNYYISQYFLRYIKKPIEYSYYSKVVYSGDILPDLIYRITSSTTDSPSITYNGVTYTGNNTTFTGSIDAAYFTKTVNTIVKQYSVSDVSDYVHQEIINIAVNMLIENVGDAERYQTNSIELNKME